MESMSPHAHTVADRAQELLDSNNNTPKDKGAQQQYQRLKFNTSDLKLRLQGVSILHHKVTVAFLGIKKLEYDLRQGWLNTVPSTHVELLLTKSKKTHTIKTQQQGVKGCCVT